MFRESHIQRCVYVIVFAALIALFTNASHAWAQDGATFVTPPDNQLSSINTESDWATALYVSSVIEMTVGVAATATGLVGAVGCIGGTASTSCGDGFGALIVAGLVMATIGAISLPIAIGLDIDSGSRRRGLQRALNLTPTPFGLVLTGRF